MATSKTLKPTNTTVSIPAMSDRPNQGVNSTTMSALADAINSLYDKLVKNSLGTQLASAAAAEAALTTEYGNMSTLEMRVVSFSLSTADGPFTQAPYVGFLMSMGSSQRARVILFRSGWYEIITAFMDGNGWHWASVDTTVIT